MVVSRNNFHRLRVLALVPNFHQPIVTARHDFMRDVWIIFHVARLRRVSLYDGLRAVALANVKHRYVCVNAARKHFRIIRVPAPTRNTILYGIHPTNRH